MGDDDYSPRIFDIGRASESGSGDMVEDAFLETELINRHKIETQAREKKIAELQNLLNVSRDQAEQFIDQAASSESKITRPDIFYKEHKKGVATQIREIIVPRLITKFRINIKDRDLQDCPLFSSKYKWIAQSPKFRDNGALLATYFNTFLRDAIGANRKDWTMEDYTIAEEKLQTQVEYVDKLLESYFKVD